MFLDLTKISVRRHSYISNGFIQWYHTSIHILMELVSTIGDIQGVWKKTEPCIEYCTRPYTFHIHILYRVPFILDTLYKMCMYNGNAHQCISLLNNVNISGDTSTSIIFSDISDWDRLDVKLKVNIPGYDLSMSVMIG